MVLSTIVDVECVVCDDDIVVGESSSKEGGGEENIHIWRHACTLTWNHTLIHPTRCGPSSNQEPVIKNGESSPSNCSLCHSLFQNVSVRWLGFHGSLGY